MKCTRCRCVEECRDEAGEVDKIEHVEHIGEHVLRSPFVRFWLPFKGTFAEFNKDGWVEGT